MCLSVKENFHRTIIILSYNVRVFQKLNYTSYGLVLIACSMNTFAEQFD